MLSDRVVNRCVVFVGKDTAGHPCIMLIIPCRFAYGGRLGYSCIIPIINFEKVHWEFVWGLSSKLQDRLAIFKFNTFSQLVNEAIIHEDAHLAHKAEKKRKAPAPASSSSNPQRFRLVQSSPQRAPSQHQPASRPLQQ